jgi:hypothetical protein
MNEELATFLDALKDNCDNRTLPFDENDDRIIKAIGTALKITMGNRDDEVSSARDEGFDTGHDAGYNEAEREVTREIKIRLNDLIEYLD